MDPLSIEMEIDDVLQVVTRRDRARFLRPILSGGVSVEEADNVTY